MTIGGIHGQGGNEFNEENPADVWIDIMYNLKDTEDKWNNLLQNDPLDSERSASLDSGSCGPGNWNFFARDRLPDHVLETFGSFNDFVSVFYKWLECSQSLNSLGQLKDLDETFDSFLILFKRVFAAGFPDKTFKLELDEEEKAAGDDGRIIDFINPELSKIQVKNFLKYVKEFYGLKSIEEAYKWFFKTLYASEVEVSYPKVHVHRCSEGNYLGESAGITMDPCYYWGDHYTIKPKWSDDPKLPENNRYPECIDFNTNDVFGNCVPVPFPDYGPTGPCYFNSDNQLCWGGGSYDAEGNELYPPCDSCGGKEILVGDGDPQTRDADLEQKVCLGCAPGHPCGIYYENDNGLLSGFSRIHDNKIWQNYSYLLDAEIPWDSYKTWVRSILHPAGMYFAGNFTVTDEFPQPGTTGEISPVETPIIGNYAPYRFNTVQNLRSNINGADLYGCGWNPAAGGQGVSYTSQHIKDSGGIWYKYELGTTAHDPAHRVAPITGLNTSGPLGLTGTTGGFAASQYGVSFFRIFHHPSAWSSTVPSGTLFKDITLGQMIFLSPIDSNSSSPNNASESSSGCGF